MAHLYIFILFSFVFISNNVFAAPTCDTNDIGGTVFRDLDADGEQDTIEVGISGVVVSASNSAGVVQGTATTDSTGDWKISDIAGSALRIEISSFPDYLYSGAVGAGSNAAVTFSSSASCGINFALNNPSDYCEADPTLVTACFVRGDPLGAGTSGALDALVSFPFSASGAASDASGPAPTHLAVASEIGSAWGVAHQRSSNKVFVAANFRRFMGLGPLGTGGIYSIDLDDSTPAITQFIDLQTIGADTGSNPRTGGDLSVDWDDNTGVDPHSALVGKTSLGGITISEDEKTLWIINLEQRSLLKLFIDNPARTPGSSDLTEYSIPDPGCSNAEYRPWAITFNDGLVYVGVVCTAETSQSRADLKAYILTLDPDQSTPSFSTVLNFVLDYNKGYAVFPTSTSITPHRPLNISNAELGGRFWFPWTSDANGGLDIIALSTYIQEYVKPLAVYPTPILSDIDFSADGKMYLAFLDRFASQVGRFDAHIDPIWDPAVAGFPGAPTWNVAGISGGDILCAYKNGSGVWEVENNGSCGTLTSSGAGNSQGPGGGEFFYQELLDDGGEIHQETSQGGIYYHRQSGKMALIAMDPISIFSSGAIFLDGQDGTTIRRYEIVPAASNVDDPTAGKANGLGDIVAACGPAPIQIGNIVWLDLDKDGVYDAGETPLSGVTVQLYNSSGTLISSTTTDSNGQYLFSNLDFDSTYTIKLCNSSDFTTGGALHFLALTELDSGTNDGHDSDSSLDNAACPSITVTTGVAGQNNHTYDFGFISTDCEERSLTSRNALIDQAYMVLFNIVTHTIALRNNVLAPSGICSALDSEKVNSITLQADSAHLSGWSYAWSFGNEHVKCDDDVIPVGCSSTSLASTKAALRSELRTLYNAFLQSIRNCNSSKLNIRTRRAKRYRDITMRRINRLPDNLVSGACM